MSWVILRYDLFSLLVEHDISVQDWEWEPMVLDVNLTSLFARLMITTG